MTVTEDQTESFIARIWFEPREIDQAALVWRGVVEHVGSKERRYFSDLSAIPAFILQQVWGVPSTASTRVQHDEMRHMMIDNLFQLRKQVFAGLDLTAEIIETQGQDLDVGEKFKVRFTVTHNLYDPATGWYEGAVCFVDCILHLEATEHARPVAGNVVDLPLGQLTFVGQTVEQIVEFKALSRLPRATIGGVVFDPPETYVKARVEAVFDIGAFFEYWHAEEFRTQIEAG